jgi:hypothetical protein
MLFFTLWVLTKGIASKGIVSREKYFFEGLNIKLVYLCTYADGFIIFCFFIDETIKLTVLACSFETTY